MAVVMKLACRGEALSARGGTTALLGATGWWAPSPHAGGECGVAGVLLGGTHSVRAPLEGCRVSSLKMGVYLEAQLVCELRTEERYVWEAEGRLLRQEPEGAIYTFVQYLFIMHLLHAG